MNPLAMKSQGTLNQAKYLGLEEIPYSNDSILSSTDYSKLNSIYSVESSSLIIDVMVSSPQLEIVCSNLPFLGEKIRILSSFQPLTMHLAVLGK